MKMFKDQMIFFTHCYRLKQLIESNFDYFLLYLKIKEIRSLKGLNVYFNAEDWHTAYLSLEKEKINVLVTFNFHLGITSGVDISKMVAKIKEIYPSITFTPTAGNLKYIELPTNSLLEQLSCDVFSTIGVRSSVIQQQLAENAVNSIYMYDDTETVTSKQLITQLTNMLKMDKALVLTLLQLMPPINSAFYNIDERILFMD